MSLFFSDDYKKKLDENGKFTDDIPYLNVYENHYLFVYGTLKRGCSKQLVLSSSQKNRFCGTAMTFGKFDMHICKPHGFPVIFDGVSKDRDAKVRGELWLVPTETILKCDQIEAQGLMYDRVFEKVHVRTETIPCFMYVGVKEFWRSKDTADNPRIIENNKPHHWYNEKIAERLSLT